MRCISCLLFFLKRPFPASFSSFQHIRQYIDFTLKVCGGLDSNHGPLVSEANTLPTELQPFVACCWWCSNKSSIFTMFWIAMHQNACLDYKIQSKGPFRCGDFAFQRKLNVSIFSALPHAVDCHQSEQALPTYYRYLCIHI